MPRGYSDHLLYGGGVYFVLGVCEMVFIDNAPIQTVLLEKLHLLLVESPGGGLWYVEALLWMIVVVFFTYKKPSDLTVYWVVSIVLYLLRAIWTLNDFAGGAFAWLHKVYFSVFLSERTFFFYSIYFFTGILLFRHQNNTNKLSIKSMLLIGASLGGIFGISHYAQEGLLVSLISLCIKLFIIVVVFLLSAKLFKGEQNNFIIANARTISTVVYFTHFLAIYIIKIVFRVLGIEYDSIVLFLSVVGLLLGYSILLINFDKKRWLLGKLY